MDREFSTEIRNLIRTGFYLTQPWANTPSRRAGIGNSSLENMIFQPKKNPPRDWRWMFSLELPQERGWKCSWLPFPGGFSMDHHGEPVSTSAVCSASAASRERIPYLPVFHISFEVNIFATTSSFLGRVFGFFGFFFFPMDVVVFQSLVQARG